MENISGFINLNKPSGMSSAAAVAKVKRATGMPCGHMGTLDPMAAGVLPVAVGNAARLFNYLLEKEKVYRAVFRFGEETDTLDATGELADVELPVVDSAARKPAAVLYCLDSHDYSTLPGIEGYGWFEQEQVAWLRGRCAARTSENGGTPLPALAFFHIALPEYVAAWRNPDNSRIGRAAEEECPGVLNPGLFAAMAESRSVMGTFVGHDHDIDYLVAEQGIVLGYGRFSGDNTTYNNLRPGARVIVLSEGVRGFETWIREDDGRIVDHVRFEGGKIVKYKQ